MNDLKKEIQKAIGETASHKVNVWHKLQQPKRNHRKPLFVTAALVVLASLWFLTLQFQPANEQTADMQIGVTQHSKDGLSFTLLHYEQQKPPYLNNDFAISHAKNENEYKALAEQMKILEEPIDFTTYDVLFALYTSDGCGLVINQLTKTDNTLQVYLELPSDLRDEKELNCTTIAAPHLAIIEIEKLAIEQATFIQGTQTLDTAFNKLDIDSMNYHFELITDSDALNSIQIKDLLNGTSITIDEEAIKKELPRLTLVATALPGIANIGNPQYEIFVQANDGQSQKIYLWITPASDTITIMSSRDTHQIYAIPKSEAQFILSFIN